MIFNLLRNKSISIPTSISSARLQSVKNHLGSISNMSSSSSAPAHSHKDGSTKWASNDGQFKRQVSSFRDEIKKGGKFEPEIGQ